MPVANPILPGCFPDPSICRVGEWHYLVASTFELLPGMPVMRSRDLATWETIGHVLDRPGMVDLAGIRSSGGIFAPTIRYDGERFWIVTTLVDPADGERGGTFLVTADDAAGPWSDPIWIEVAGIDPSLLFDDDGRVWMHGTRLVAEPEWHHQTEVWVRELSIDEGRLVGDEHVVWTGAVRGAVWAEGPHLLRIDGTCYLLAAEGGQGLIQTGVVGGPPPETDEGLMALLGGRGARPARLGRGQVVTGVETPHLTGHRAVETVGV